MERTEDDLCNAFLVECSEYTRWAWSVGPISPTERLTLLALTEYSDNAGMVDVPLSTLATMTGLPEIGVREYLLRLEDNELITAIPDDDGWLLHKDVTAIPECA